MFKIIYKLHKYLGIFLAFHLIITMATGTILLFEDGFFLDDKASEEHQSIILDSQQIQRATDQAKQMHPNARLLSTFIDESNSDILKIRLGKDGTKKFRGAIKLEYNLVQDKFIQSQSKEDDFFDFILELHRDLLLGTLGKLYVGVLGLIFCFILISGFYIYRPFSKNSFLGSIRLESFRFFLSDTHKAIGMFTFSWCFLIALTGSFLAFNSTLIKTYQYFELKELREQYKEVETTVKDAPLAQIIDSIDKRFPNKDLDFIAFADTEFSLPMHYLALVKGRGRFEEKLSSLAIVHRESGKIEAVREFPLYLKALLLSEPLHFGDYGGNALKVIWLVFSLISFWLPVGAITLFFFKKKKPAYFQRTSKRKLQARFKWQHRPYLLTSTLSLFILTSVAVQLFIEENEAFYFSLILFITIVFFFFMINSKVEEEPENA